MPRGGAGLILRGSVQPRAEIVHLNQARDGQEPRDMSFASGPVLVLCRASIAMQGSQGSVAGRPGEFSRLCGAVSSCSSRSGWARQFVPVVVLAGRRFPLDRRVSRARMLSLQAWLHAGGNCSMVRKVAYWVSTGLV